MTEVIEQPVHWPRGGSVSDPIVVCPGRVNMAEQYPADPSSSYAIEGTHDHSALELALTHNIVDARLLKGKVYTDHEGDYEVDDARADRIQVALDYVHHKMRNSKTMQLWSERFLDAGKAFGIPGWGGSADIILFDTFNHYLEVVDFKGGGKPVSPETYQMVTYGIGARNELPSIPSTCPTVCTIVQPKVSREPKSVTYSPIEWDVKVKILADAMRKSLDPNAPRAAGDHCKYCRGAKPGRCPEYNAVLQQGVITVNEMFGSVPPAPATVGHQSSTPQAMPLQIPSIGAETTDEQLAQILDAEPIIKEMFKEANAEAIRRAQRGVSIPGRKLVRGKTNRKLADHAIEVFEAMRLKKEVYLEEKLKSPAAILGHEDIKAMSARKRKRIDEIILKPEGALQLVPESDPRKAITQTPEEMFPPTQEVEHKQVATSRPAPISFM